MTDPQSEVGHKPCLRYEILLTTFGLIVYLPGPSFHHSTGINATMSDIGLLVPSSSRSSSEWHECVCEEGTCSPVALCASVLTAIANKSWGYTGTAALGACLNDRDSVYSSAVDPDPCELSAL